MTTLWKRVDDPVLRWVASLPSALSGEMHTLELRDPELFEPIPCLNSREVDESLRRLRSHGLIDGQSADAREHELVEPARDRPRADRPR